MKDFKNKLKKLRKQHKLTQKQVAQKLNVSYQSYQAYEMGKPFPTLPHFIMLANIFEVSLEFLIGKNDWK